MSRENLATPSEDIMLSHFTIIETFVNMSSGFVGVGSGIYLNQIKETALTPLELPYNLVLLCGLTAYKVIPLGLQGGLWSIGRLKAWAPTGGDLVNVINRERRNVQLMKLDGSCDPTVPLPTDFLYLTLSSVTPLGPWVNRMNL